MGTQPIMEMVQQLFRLLITLRYSVPISNGAAISHYLASCLVCSLCLSPFFSRSPITPPCHYCLSYLPGERANSIRGTGPPPASLMHFLSLPVSLSLSQPCPSVGLAARLPTFSYPMRSISTQSSSTLPCWLSLQAVEPRQTVVGPSPMGPCLLSGSISTLIVLGVMDPSPACPLYCLVSGTH